MADTKSNITRRDRMSTGAQPDFGSLRADDFDSLRIDDALEDLSHQQAKSRAQADWGILHAAETWKAGKVDTRKGAPAGRRSSVDMLVSNETTEDKIQSPRARSCGSILMPHEEDDMEKATMYTFNERKESWGKQPVRIRIADKPFQQGTFRVCYKLWMMDENHQEQVMVAKIFKKEKPPAEYFNEAFGQVISQGYAEEFNKIGISRTVRFVPVHVLKLHERGGALVNVEPFLDGKYVKHNDNDGHVDSADPVPQAFSHFSWHASEGKLLICDIQGVDDHFTDPSIQTPDGDAMFGAGNMGTKTIIKFFQSHKCNFLCRAHRLRPSREELQSIGACSSSEETVPDRGCGARKQSSIRAAPAAAPASPAKKDKVEGGSRGWGVALKTGLPTRTGTSSPHSSLARKPASPMAAAFRRMLGSAEP